MKKTITSVVAMGIMSATGLAQEAGKGTTPKTTNAPAEANKGGGTLIKAAHVANTDSGRIKGANATKQETTQPAPAPAEKSDNPGIKPARQAPAKEKK